MPARSPLLTRLRTLLATLALVGACTPVLAAYDSIRIMIGANPGGGYDQTGRAVGAAMIAAGQARTASYDNKAGAGGTIGLAQFVNSDKNNPAALMVVGAVMVGAIETNKPPVSLKNATPIARLYADTMILVVPAASPIKTVAELVDRLKANPGAVSWGGGSKGSTDHILAGLIAKAAGIDPRRINYVPLQGGGEASAAILGGHVTVGIAGVSEFKSFVQSGKMRALAVSSAAPVDSIRTLKEQGLPVEIYNWRGVYGAPGLSAEQRQALIASVVKATETPAWKETLVRNDWGAFLLTGDDFGSFVASESLRMGAILRELGVAR